MVILNFIFRNGWIYIIRIIKKLKQSANVIYEEGKESIDDNRVAVLRGLCFNPNYFYFNVENEEDKRKGRNLVNSCHDKYGSIDFKEQDFWSQIAIDYKIGEMNE